MNNSRVYSLSRVWTYGIIVGAVVGTIIGYIFSIVLAVDTPSEYPLLYIFIFTPFFFTMGGVLGAIITPIIALLYKNSKRIKSPRFLWVIVVGLGAMLGVHLFVVIIPSNKWNDFIEVIPVSMTMGILGATLGWVSTKITVTPNYEQSINHPVLRSVLCHCLSFTATASIILTSFVIVLNR